MNKSFRIDNITINISEEVFLQAKKSCILNEDEILTVAYIKNAIRANLCKSDEDFKTFSFKNAFSSHTEKELSEIVEKELKKDISESIF